MARRVICARLENDDFSKKPQLVGGWVFQFGVAVMDVINLEPRAAEAASLLMAMAHQKRLMVLCHLLSEELSVNVLADRLELPQPTLSQHLAKLRDLKLVKTRREGNVVYYSLASSDVEVVLQALAEVFC